MQRIVDENLHARDDCGSPKANAVDFESGKRRRDGYTALLLSRSTRRQRDASLHERIRGRQTDSSIA
jgi:hypothetical protein